jgi:gamma-glutamylcysteine synthetase
MVAQGRTAFWETAFGSNAVVPKEEGDDVHLFTLNAANQVHVDVSRDEAVTAVNVLNGLAGAQIALTAHSSVWRDQVDPEYRCVSEMLWDWWLPAKGRVGVPARPFNDLEDYVDTIARLSPVYVKRDGEPLGIMHYGSFYDYYREGELADALNVNGQPMRVHVQPDDIDQHMTFQWFAARISRYHTVENRMNDQQPPDGLLCIAALTLGLTEALAEAWEEVSSHTWEALCQARVEACRQGLGAQVGQMKLRDLAQRALSLARDGLLARELGEESFLEPLERRIDKALSPADEAADAFKKHGIEAVVRILRL